MPKCDYEMTKKDLRAGVEWLVNRHYNDEEKSPSFQLGALTNLICTYLGIDVDVYADKLRDRRNK